MRTDYCGAIDRRFLGQTVTLQGWAHRRRDHGGVIFIDLRDREGLVQVVSDPDNVATFAVAESVRTEFVLQIVGRVRLRPEGTVNSALRSGEIEVLADSIEVLNPSLTPPFQMDEDNLSETVRLTYRYLDLRRPAMQRNFRLRYKASMVVRQFLDSHGFIDIETPMLTKSTPQLFKQLLMVAGFDRYYQITKCFRDEDLRADRQPEFTQIDIETSFMDEHDITGLMEQLVRTLFKQVIDADLPAEFPRMTWHEAMHRFGSDKPDLRIPLEFTELTDLMKTVDFKVFRAAADLANGRVAALRVPGGATISRKEIDDYTTFVGIYGAKGLAYIKVNDVTKADETGLQSPIVKFLPQPVLVEILQRTGAQDGDLVFFAADTFKVVCDSLGALRLKVGHERGFSTGGWKPLWVVDFPMFEYDEDDKRWVALHHPFTAPKAGHEGYVESDPGKAVARAYDVVLNGWEIGGGSVRIHREEVQSAVFRALNIGPEEAKAKFGFLLDALQYGAPPHGGIAFGFDRLTSMMAGVEQIRDVIAFPKTQRAQCMLTDAPSPVDEKQLRELHIKLR